MNVIFSGGPANNRCLEILDNVLEWRFPISPPMTWNGTYSTDKTNVQAACYIRTEYINTQGLTIYEFIGIR